MLSTEVRLFVVLRLARRKSAKSLPKRRTRREPAPRTIRKTPVPGRGKDAFDVVGSTGVTIVDAASAQVTGTIPLAGVVDDDDDATEMEVTGDGRRAFVRYGPQHKVAVLDLEQRKAIGVAKTGRGGKKSLNTMKAG